MTGTAYGYGRGSTDAQVITLEKQQHLINEWYAAHGSEYAWGGTMLDAAVSATKPWVQRPMGAFLAVNLKPGDCLVTAELDRLIRSAGDMHAVSTLLAMKNVELIVLDSLGLDAATPHGKMVYGVRSVMAEFERDLVAKRTKGAMGQLKRQGRFISHIPPLGWTPGEPIDEVNKLRKTRFLVPDEIERRHARTCVRYIDRLKTSFRKTAKILKERGITRSPERMAYLGSRATIYYSRWTVRGLYDACKRNFATEGFDTEAQKAATSKALLRSRKDAG